MPSYIKETSIFVIFESTSPSQKNNIFLKDIQLHKLSLIEIVKHLTVTFCNRSNSFSISNSIGNDKLTSSSKITFQVCRYTRHFIDMVHIV